MTQLTRARTICRVMRDVRNDMRAKGARPAVRVVSEPLTSRITHRILSHRIAFRETFKVAAGRSII